jgi:transcriptional regulator with XRE-family HTH domain
VRKSIQEVKREIGRRVQRAREASELTQEQAAHKAGIDWRRWQRIEAGLVNPTIATLDRVARAVGATIDVTFRR